MKWETCRRTASGQNSPAPLQLIEVHRRGNSQITVSFAFNSSVKSVDDSSLSSVSITATRQCPRNLHAVLRLATVCEVAFSVIWMTEGNSDQPRSDIEKAQHGERATIKITSQLFFLPKRTPILSMKNSPMPMAQRIPPRNGRIFVRAHARFACSAWSGQVNRVLRPTGASERLRKYLRDSIRIQVYRIVAQRPDHNYALASVA